MDAANLAAGVATTLKIGGNNHVIVKKANKAEKEMDSVVIVMSSLVYC